MSKFQSVLNEVNKENNVVFIWDCSDGERHSELWYAVSDKYPIMKSAHNFFGDVVNGDFKGKYNMARLPNGTVVITTYVLDGVGMGAIDMDVLEDVLRVFSWNVEHYDIPMEDIVLPVHESWSLEEINTIVSGMDFYTSFKIVTF